jgi:hypothetical protein
MGWRSGQSYSQDLRERVLGAVDSGMAVSTSGGDLRCEHRLNLQGIDPAVADARQGNKPEPRPSAAQVIARPGAALAAHIRSRPGITLARGVAAGAV